MAKTVKYTNLGLIDYKKAWDHQERTLLSVVDSRLEASGSGSGKMGHLLFCEHPHVYTLGKSGADSNLLMSEERLKEIGASYYHINRGGDITYHGPGQLVGYPIFDLEGLGLGVRKYMWNLEEAIVLMLKEYGIEAGRLEGATGVWLDGGKPGLERKICAMGVRVSRLVSMHGFALNINTKLDYFGYINPCGFTDKGVTSLARELGAEQDMDNVRTILKDKISEVFSMEIEG